jgi:hypothetical protein
MNADPRTPRARLSVHRADSNEMYLAPPRDRFRRNDELAVLISLLVSVGMLLGTAVIVWMWTLVSGGAATVIVF